MHDVMPPRRLVHLQDIERFALEQGGKRIGFLSYTLERRKTMLIDVVVVDPDAQGDPVDSELMTAAVSWARDHGFLIIAQCAVARAMMEAMRVA
jgi:predicted GNAT family acetyltransferase